MGLHEGYGLAAPRAQIPGDGYWGTNDPDILRKNLKLEVDYDATCVGRTTLRKALDLVKDSIYPQVGIDVSYVIDNTVWVAYIDRQVEKSLLAGNRNDEYKGIGKGYVHVIVVSQFSGDTITLGRAVNYAEPKFERRNLTYCSYLSSGDLGTMGHSQAYLDSVGCMVYVNTIFIHRVPESTFIDSAHMLAVIIGHEVGHAIGLEHKDEDLNKGIMSSKINFYRPCSLYMKFNKATHWDSVGRSLINLREVLGRERVEFCWGPPHPQ